MAVIKDFKKSPFETVAKVSGAKSISDAIKIANEASRNTGKSVFPGQNNPAPIPAPKSETKKSAVDLMWERGSNAPQKTEFDDYRKTILGLQKELQAKKDSDTRSKAEKALPAWAYMMSDKDAMGYLKDPEGSGYTERMLAEQEQKNLQGQIDRARDEMNYRANAGKIDSMGEEQKQDLETLAKADNGFLSREMWSDGETINALLNPEENPFNQRLSARRRLMQSGISGDQLKGLVETYQRDMNRRDAEQAMGDSRQKVESGLGGAVSENAAAFAYNLAGNITGTLETVDQDIQRALGGSIYTTADPNRPGYRPSQKAAAAREAQSEQILGENPTFLRKAANLLYKGGTSAIDNVLRGILGGGTVGSLALAGMGSFQDSYRSAVERGAGDETALLYGSVTAALEVATEFLPTEHLLGGKSAKECESLLKRAFVQAGLEIPGEEISLWGEIIADASIMGDKSENNRLRAELIANGYSKEQADNEIMRRNLMQSAETALTTLISSGISTVAQGKVDAVSDRIDSIGKDTLNTENSVVKNAPISEKQMAQKSVEDTARELGQKVPKAAPEVKTQEQINLDRAIMETLGVASEKESGSVFQNNDGHSGEKTENSKLFEGAQQTDTQNMSANGGQNQGMDGTKGPVAAESNFSGKAAYQELLSDENAQRDRVGDVRPVEVPKTDANGRRVTEFAGDAYGAEVTPDRMAKEIESLIQDGDLSFDTRSNKQSLENAAAAIDSSGEDAVRMQIAENAASGIVADGDIEKGLLLYAKYANDPEKQDMASGLLVDLGTIANMSGRNLQMFSLMRRMTPEGQLMTIQKNISRYVDTLNQGRSGNKKVDLSGDSPVGKVYERYGVAINEGLAKQFLDAKTNEEKSAALDQIYMDVASKIKPTLGEQWDAWRNLSMLGNFLTHERNILSTAAFQPFSAVKRNIGAVVEKAFVPKEQRTKSVLGQDKVSQDLLAFAKQDAKSKPVGDLMRYSSKTGDEARSKIQDYRKIMPGVLDTVAKKNMEFMESSDMYFKRGEYARSLAGFLKARGYTAQQIQNGSLPAGILDEARTYAVREAQRATFNDRNGLSDFIAKLGRPSKKKGFWSTVGNIVKQGNVPFLRTPANVLARAVEYNPLSLTKTLITAKSDIDSGRLSAADVVDRISSGLTGTAAMGLGAALSAGLIPGVKLYGKVYDEDEKREGAQDYSIKIGDKYYSIAWLAPAMIPLLMGANFYNKVKILSEQEGVDGWDVASAILELAVDSIDPILELSTLSGLNETLDTVSREEGLGNKAVALFISSAGSYLNQALPTVFGQLEKATEDRKSSTYVNTDNDLERAIKKTISMATRKVPGIDLYQTEKLDEFGQPVMNDENKGKRTLNALFNPFSVSQETSDPLTKEITRLNRATGENNAPPDTPYVVSYTGKSGKAYADYRLTEKEYNTLAKTTGQTAKQIADAMIKSKDYDALTDTQKAEAMKLAYQYAQEKGRGAALEDYPEMSGWMAGIDGKEAGIIVKKVMSDTLDRAISDLSTAWKQGWDDSAGTKALESAYDTLQSMSLDAMVNVVAQSSKTIQKYAEAREVGISNDRYVEILKQKAAMESKKGGELNQAENIQRLAKIAGVPDRQRETLLKAEVSDAQDQNIDEVKAIVTENGMPQNYLKLYAELYDITENYTKGTGKRKRTVAHIAEQYNISRQVAGKLYDAMK